ncbi:MAG TPA: membrane protein insertion efficiency factor YidD [Methylophilaceae bacterium]
MSRLLIGLIRIYQWTLSPFFGQQCRFSPTCSQYAIEAINKHGALHGSAYTIRRLSHCHPWHAGGHDPVP